MFTANQEIILNLNLTFKIKQILKSTSNYVSNVLDVTAYMRWMEHISFLQFQRLSLSPFGLNIYSQLFRSKK
jgi:hypothetical protein